MVEPTYSEGSSKLEKWRRQENKDNEAATEEEFDDSRFLPSEQRSDVDSTRRDVDDRRQSDEPFAGEDRRTTPERRSDAERRDMTYNVKCKTSGATATIENYLNERCEGKWNIRFQDMDDKLITKSLRIMFELASDRKNFHDYYVKSVE